MTFQEEMKKKRELAMRRMEGVDERTVDEKAKDLIEDWLIPLFKVDMIFYPIRDFCNIELYEKSDGVWCPNSKENDIEIPFSKEVLTAAVKKAEEYGLIGIDRYKDGKYMSFTLLLVDESKVLSVYDRTRYLNL